MIKNGNLIRTQAYIDGNWVNDAEGKSFAVYNPFDGKKVADVPDLGIDAVREAIESAYWAFPPWSGLLARERGQKLKRLAELMQQNEEDLAVLLTLEQGKPLQEARGEVAMAIESVNWFAEEVGRVYGLTHSNPDEGRSVMTILQPIGVVAVITPWNFPLLVPVQRSFCALAAGCTVVLKPAEDTPLCMLALAYLSQEAGIPKGVFNVVTCQNPEEVGKVLATHPLVGKLTFTGSTEVGRHLMSLCASTLKKLTLELGGNCPVIVFEDADVEKAVQGILDLKFFNGGQCCISINRILVHRSLYDAFIDRFAEKVKELTVGNGLEAVNMGPLINEQAKQKVEELVADAAVKGGTILTGKKELQGLLCAPVIIKDANDTMRMFKEEIFGPVAVFYPFDTEDEAVAIANDTRHGLAAYFYTENLARLMRVAQELEAGTVGINTTNTYSVMIPFGGWKESGIGREGGIQGSLNDYCELKAISIGK